MRIENLTFSYDEQLIFDRLNMTVEKNRLNVIVLNRMALGNRHC